MDWAKWMNEGARDYVAFGAYVGNADARALVPEVTPFRDGKSLAAFLQGFEDLPWKSRSTNGPYHFALVRMAVALGRAVLPKARKMNESEAAAEMLYTTEAWIIWPHELVRSTLERQHFYSAPPTAPREFQFQFAVAAVVFSPSAFERVVKMAEKILGRAATLEAILRELRARFDDDDPVRRSIGERIFFCLTLESGVDDAMVIEQFPPGWPKDRALTAKGERRVDVVANPLGLFIVSERLKAWLEEALPTLEHVKCTVNGEPAFWVKPRETHRALARGTIATTEARFLQLDASKCEDAPRLFFLGEAPRFVCAEIEFIREFRAHDFDGLVGFVLPFGAPRKSRIGRVRTRGRRRSR